MGPRVEYASVAALTELLQSVDRPGDFCAHGRLYLPMPTVEVEGVGVLSFPVLDAQVESLINAAERAPYGKGSETIVDAAVRDCWQVDPTRLRISGRAWDDTFATILRAAAEGLGCDAGDLDAHLYKLLVYPTGGFFAPHRDTEKVDGMVATLAISLPTAGVGGELAVRHAGREVVIDMNAEEPSELAFAAFYSDCSHETRPLRSGHRLSLVFNLCIRSGVLGAPRRAPDNGAVVKAVAERLAAWARDGDQDKLVWLLEHDYSSAGLSFDTLKNADRSVADVLKEASRHANCAVHAAVVHIEEWGDAQYEDGEYVDSWNWREPDADEMEIGELFESRHWLDGWVSADGTRPSFDEIPLHGAELLPADALDGSEPDEQRVHEATGNEGVSLERTYRSAALAIWPLSKTLDVVAAAGMASAVAWLAAQFPPDSGPANDRVRGLAERLIEIWAQSRYEREDSATASRASLLGMLTTLGDGVLVLRFLRTVMLAHYGGGENASLLAALALTDQAARRQFVSDFIDAHLLRRPNPVLALLDAASESQEILDRQALGIGIERAVAGLPAVLDPARGPEQVSLLDKREPISASGVRDLLAVAWRCGASAAADRAAALVIEHTRAVTPERAIPTVLDGLRREDGLAATHSYAELWRHATESLLARSATHPAPPADWAIPADIDCSCELCDRLRAFCADPAARVERFAVRSELRKHLHRIIDTHRLDMFHETERRGRPYTLVCTKNRASHERRLAQYAEDVSCMDSLVTSMPGGRWANTYASHAARLRAATLAEAAE